MSEGKREKIFSEERLLFYDEKAEISASELA
jgi:hypothetical protein